MTYLTKMEMVENVPIRFYSLLWSLHIPSNIVAFVWRKKEMNEGRGREEDKILCSKRAMKSKV